MNWGKGIAIALSLFIGFILFLAITLMSQKVDLVSEDYYQKEIVFEDEIVARKNAAAIESKMEISQTDQFLVVKIPEGTFEGIQMKLKRPNDDRLDISFTIEGTHLFMVDKNKLEEGRYDIALEFMYDNEPCHQRENIFLNK